MSQEEPKEERVDIPLPEPEVLNHTPEVSPRARAKSELPSDEELEQSTWDTLMDLAGQLWTTASSYLTGEEQEQYKEQQRRSIDRMDTVELRSHVRANRDLQEVQSNVMRQKDLTGEDLAKAQRSAIRMQSGEVNFDGELLAVLMEEALNPEENTVNASKFLEAANGVPLLMGGLGRTFEFANSDLMKKLDVADKRMKETAKSLKISVREVTLQQMVELDIKNGTTHAGKKAAPASRTILRLMWFFDFIATLLRKLQERPKATLREVCSATYEETLAPRHIWILRRAAQSGMRLLPSKDTFRKSLGTMGLSEQKEGAKLKGWSEKVQTTNDVMWEFMKEKNLEVLP